MATSATSRSPGARTHEASPGPEPGLLRVRRLGQNDTGQPVGQEDNTSYGTTAAEFLLWEPGPEARRWAAASPPSPPTSARSTTTPPGRP